MKPPDIGSPSEVLWFTYRYGIYQPQPRDTGSPSEDLSPYYGAEIDHHKGGE